MGGVKGGSHEYILQPDGPELWLQGTMLRVAPVSTKYLSFVNLSVRKINPAFARKCIAVAMTCVGLAAEPKVVRRHAIFPIKNRAGRTCSPYWHNNCEICTLHCQDFGRTENLGGKGGDFWGRLYRSFCRLSSHCWEQGSYFAVSRQLRL